MPANTKPAMTAFKAAAHETLVANLRNTHALEKQTVAVMEAQLDVLTDYPDLHTRVTEHITESREQARRLEATLEACGSSSSMVKDALLSVMGRGQSSVQSFSDDAVLKAMAANTMTEHLEIATYRTLLALADMAGKSELRPRLEESLREEEAMADWLEQNLDATTRRFVEIKALQLEAEPAPSAESPTADGKSTKTLWQTLESAQSTDPTEAEKASAQPARDRAHETPPAAPMMQSKPRIPADAQAPGDVAGRARD